MVLFGSLLDQFVGSFDLFNVLSTFEFVAVRFITFPREFNRRIQWIRNRCSVHNFQETMIKIFGGMYDDIIVSILNFETRCSISAASLV